MMLSKSENVDMQCVAEPMYGDMSEKRGDFCESSSIGAYAAGVGPLCWGPVKTADCKVTSPCSCENREC